MAHAALEVGANPPSSANAFSHSLDPKRPSACLILLDHLVGAAEDRPREEDLKRCRGLQVDDQL
jgi:hypothetical protein